MKEITINHFEKSETLKNLERQVAESHSLLHEQTIKEMDDYKEKILQLFKNLYGKYIKLTITGQSSQEIFFIQPYRYIKENDCLFGLICKPQNEFKGGVDDTAIGLFEKFEKNDVKITEITEDEFRQEIDKSVERCIKQMVDKMNNPDYELTDFGWKYKITSEQINHWFNDLNEYEYDEREGNTATTED